MARWHHEHVEIHLELVKNPIYFVTVVARTLTVRLYGSRFSSSTPRI